MNPARVAFLPANAQDGCAFYRMWLPYLQMVGSKYVSKAPVPFSDLAGCNVVVVQRLSSEKNEESLVKFKELGLGIIYDLDDDMWAIESSNPAAAKLKNAPEMVGFDRCSQHADVITCSTGRLESSVRTNMKHGVPTRIVNNAVDTAMFRPSILPKDPDRVIVGWGGSATHSEDLKQMGSSMLDLIRLESKAYLHFVGMVPDRSYIANPKILAHGWVPVHEYAARLATWNWDIYLAPLTNSRFNRSKSSIKAMEAGAMKIPCLMSDVQPFQEFTCHDKEMEWLLCKTPKDWLEKTTALVKDAAMRKHFGELCYNVVQDIYSMDVRAWVWREVYNSCVQVSQ